MKYKTLLTRLQKLTPEQLEQDVTVTNAYGPYPIGATGGGVVRTVLGKNLEDFNGEKWKNSKQLVLLVDFEDED